MESIMFTLGWTGIFAPTALGAIGSIIGCARGGMTACGAMLDAEGGYGRFIGVSAMPSSQVIYGIVVMMSLQNVAKVEGSDSLTITAANAGGLFGIGVLVGLALMISAIYQGMCCASSINTFKTKPEVFGLSVAPAGIVEGFALFAVVFSLVLSGSIPPPA